VHLPVHATPENLRYLHTKRDRMGHDLPGLPALLDENSEGAVVESLAEMDEVESSPVLPAASGETS